MPDAYSTRPEHNIGGDRLTRLKEFHKNYKDDGSNTSRNAPIEVELAYEILREEGKGNPVYFKTLIRDVISVMDKTVQNEAAADVTVYPCRQRLILTPGVQVLSPRST